MAEKQKSRKVAITGTVSPELREAVEEYRWKNRMNLSDVVTQALTEWASNHGATIPESVDEVSADEPNPDEVASKAKGK